MNEFEKELVATIIIKIAKDNTQNLIRTNPAELIKFLTKEKTMSGAKDAAESLVEAAVFFIMKSFETSAELTDFTPDELNDNLTEFLLEFMEKRS